MNWKNPQSEVVLRERQKELISLVMDEMVKRDFSVREAEKFPKALKEALQKNSERLEKEKPFAIFEF
ncbi:MAG: hypothetical protein IIV45_11955 [Lachnospiraceae bacterium]|nr:hypothetical protein [Lachnospiraceae bacterium]